MSTFKQSIVVYLFTNDLRLSDNAALNAAFEYAKVNNLSLLTLYCLEPWQFPALDNDSRKMGGERYRFLYESLAELQNQLQNMQQKLCLHIGSFEGALERICSAVKINKIFTSNPAGWYERKRVLNAAKAHDISYFETSTLYQPKQFDFSINDLPKHFTPFRKKVETLDWQHPSQAPIDRPQNFNINEFKLSKLPKPTSTYSTRLRGGAIAGQLHLKNYFSGPLPKTYKNVRNALDGWNNSTKFSAWLALGCISPREIMAELKSFELKNGSNDSTYWIFFELLWREFFFYLAIKKGIQLFSPSKNKDKKHSTQAFERWCRGKTPEPLVNACMRQLNKTGYMSNRGRQITASYLINELNVDWQLGASYFEQHLIDYDVASNSGNWQYIAGFGADPRGGRHFNVIKQQNTYDSEGIFRERWLKKSIDTQTISWRNISQ